MDKEFYIVFGSGIITGWFMLAVIASLMIII